VDLLTISVDIYVEKECFDIALINEPFIDIPKSLIENDRSVCHINNNLIETKYTFLFE